MATRIMRPKTGPYGVVASQSEADLIIPGSGAPPAGYCPELPPIDPEGPWVPASNCYNPWPYDQVYGGATAHYGYYGTSRGLVMATNPLAGQVWPECTVFFAFSGITGWERRYNQAIYLGGGCIRVSNNWPTMYHYADLFPSGGYWSVGFGGVGGAGTDYGEQVLSLADCATDWFSAPWGRWIGIIASVKFTGTPIAHFRIFDFLSLTQLNYDDRFRWFGYGAAYPHTGIRFTTAENVQGAEHRWNSSPWFDEFSGSRSPAIVGGQLSGCMAQVGVHNRYLDLNNPSNLTKIFCPDGIKDLGRGAVSIWGEQIKYYSENSSPMRNEGSVDFTTNGALSYYHPGFVGPTPPLGTCVGPPDYLTGLHFWGEFDRTIGIIGALGTPKEVYGGGALGVDAQYMLQNWTYCHTGTGQYAGDFTAGNALGTSTSAGQPASGANGLCIKSDNPVWNPDAGTTDTHWKFRAGPLARSFVPGAGNAPFEWIFFYEPFDVTMLTSTHTGVRTLFSVGSYPSGLYRDGYAVVRSDNATGNKAQFQIRHSDGTVALYRGTVTIPTRLRSMIQYRYDPDNMQVGFCVNRGTWEWVTITQKIQPGVTAGAWVGTQASQGSGSFLSTGMCGKLSTLIFYADFISDSTADGLYNTGRGMYWHSVNGPTAFAQPTYQPYARVASKGASGAMGRTDIFKPPNTTVSGSQFTFVGRILYPRDHNSGGGFNSSQRSLLKIGTSSNVQVRFDNTTLNFGITGRTNRTIVSGSVVSVEQGGITVTLADDGSNFTPELHQSWINVLCSWNGNGAVSCLYAWLPTLGWCKDSASATATNGSITLINANTRFGGNESGSFQGEIWFSHIGFKVGYIDFSVAANRDKFFDPLTGFPKAIDVAGWTEWGGQPLVWAPHGDLSRHLGTMAQWTNAGGPFPAAAPIKATDSYHGGLWITPPWTVAAPTSPTATAVGETRIDLTWVYPTSGETGFVVEISYDGSTGWTVLAMLPPGSQSYSHTPLFSATTNYYRISVTRPEGQSVPTSVVTATTGGAWAPWSLNGLILWLDAANRGSTTNRWDDRSGNGNHFLAPSSGAFPTFSGGEATFDGVNKYFNDTGDFSALTAGEIFMRLKNDFDPHATATSQGLAGFSNNGSIDVYPASTGIIHLGMGITSRPSCGNPATSLTAYHTLNTRSSGTYIVAINGTTLYTGSHAVSFTANAKIGASSHDTSYKYTGKMKAVVMYNRILSASERTLVENYLAAL